MDLRPAVSEREYARVDREEDGEVDDEETGEHPLAGGDVAPVADGGLDHRAS